MGTNKVSVIKLGGLVGLPIRLELIWMSWAICMFWLDDVVLLLT